MKKIMFAACLMGLISTPALAGGELTRNHTYLGISMGQDVYQLVLGTRNKDLAFELNGTQLDRLNPSGLNTTGDSATQFGVSVVEYLFDDSAVEQCDACDYEEWDEEAEPSNWNAFFRLGYGSATTSFSRAGLPSTTNQRVYVGAGIEYEINKKMSARLEVNRIARPTTTSGQSAINIPVTIGILRHF